MSASAVETYDVSAMFEAARSFIGGAKIIIDSEGIEEEGAVKHPTLPVILCSAIAIEIQLKALLEAHGHPGAAEVRS